MLKLPLRSELHLGQACQILPALVGRQESFPPTVQIYVAGYFLALCTLVLYVSLMPGIVCTVEGGCIVGVWAQADEPQRLGEKHVSAHSESFHFTRESAGCCLGLIPSLLVKNSARYWLTVAVMGHMFTWMKFK